jgi:signal transduction histidine kinase
MNQLPNLLIVDDTEGNLVLLEAVTKKIEANLIKAHSGLEALEKTQGIELALAIIDVRMPVMNGFELARKLNEDRSDSKVPIIFLTANYDEDSIEGYESGAVDYLYKPLQGRILQSKIKVFLDLFNQKQKIIQNTELLKESSEELKKSLEQLHSLAKYTEKAREYERKSIARELHDDLGQALTAVKIDLGIIRQNVKEENVLSKINKLSILVSDTIKTVQRLTSQLRPDIIDDLGLVAAIKWYTKEFAERNGIEIFLKMDSDIPVSPDDSITLFRIMQESLTNIARHAGASRIEISLLYDGSFVNFRISDNGIGIPETKLGSKKSFGLIGMRERANTLGGTFNIRNEAGNGTVVSLSFPCQSDICNTEDKALQNLQPNQ